VKGLAVILLFSLWTTISAQHEDIKLEINRIIINDTEFSYKETPGFIVAIIDGADNYVIDFGDKSLTTNDTLCSTDIFELGSLSKVMTASLVSQLVENGFLSYESKVNQFIPSPYSNPRLDHITIDDLLHHACGLPTRPSFFGLKNTDPGNPYKYYSKTDLLEFYRDFIPTDKTESKESKYAHTNYGLLEIVIESATSQEYGSLMKEYVFDPLEMDHSFVTFLEDRDSILTEGYDRALRKADPWRFASFGASEGIKSNLNDVISYVRAHLGTSGTRLDQMLPKNVKGSYPTNFNEFILAGRGWQVIDQRRKYDIVTHTGKTSGHHSFVAFVPETKTGLLCYLIRP